MKAVLISIQPKWCKLICSGEKTIEVRKNRPNCEVPFKCYIYCTKDKPTFTQSAFCDDISNGKVIGEFVCDEIFTLWSGYAGNNGDDCLTFDERECYLGFNEDGSNRMGYGWHITDLVVYDEPRELSEFYHYCGDNPNCDGCEAHYYSNTECGKEDYCCSPVEGCKPLKRPFQSWGYVYEADT
jgi:hypothetical protein